MIFTIAAREIRSMFLSPLAWAIIGVVQFILAYLFATDFQTFLIYVQPRLGEYATAYGHPLGVTDIVIRPLYHAAAFIMMFIIPLITMRIISEEKRSKSISLLYSAPLSMTEIVLGKYLGVVAFLGIMMLIYTLMPLSILFSGSIDWGLFASYILGTFMLTAACAAIGIFMSSLTAQPTIAAISTFGAILLLWILYFATGDASHTSNVLSYLSMLHHLQAFERGVFSTSDFTYYLLVIILFIVLSIRRLDGDRLQR